MSQQLHPVFVQAMAGIAPVQPVNKISPPKPHTIKTDVDILADMDNDLQDAERCFMQGQKHLANFRRKFNEMLPAAVRGMR